MLDQLLSDGSFFQAAKLAIILSAIPLGCSLIVGVVLSILQAATQIQEQTLTFVPKLASVVVVLFFVGPWMLGQLVDYFSLLLNNIPLMSGPI